MKKITNREDIILLVNEFYKKVAEDELLGPVFYKIIKNDWQPHLDKMYNFWETIAFDVNKYNGSPFRKHLNLPIDEQHFSRWLHLFNETADEYFTGEKIEDLKKRANQMGMMFQYKMKHIKNVN